MALPKNVIRVDPSSVGGTLTVDILDAAGTSVPAWKDQRGQSPWTLPADITQTSEFYVETAGVYYVSAKVGANEIAGSGDRAGQTSEVQASSTGYYLRPALDPSETVSVGGGSGGSGVVVRAFPFAFDTPDLVTGHTVYTPTVGDVLLNAWFEIDTQWDGTTPKSDVGTFVNTTGGAYSFAGGAPYPFSVLPDNDTNGEGTGLLSSNAWSDLAGVNAVAALRGVPAKFVTTDPIKICVSTTGFTDGADIGATQGSATLYLVTATPVT